MPNLKSQRNIASKIFKCGKSRIWIDPKRLEEAAEAITTSDVHNLVAKGIVVRLPPRPASRGRIRKMLAQKAKGRRSGHGSRKGKHAALQKSVWKKRIRVLRSMLKEMRKSGSIDKKTFRNLYLKAKGGYFRSKSHLLAYTQKEIGKEKTISREEKPKKTSRKI